MCSARTPKRAATAMRRIGKIRGRGFFKYPHRCLKWHSHRRWLHFHNRLPQVRVRQQRLIHFAIAGCICLEKWLRLCFAIRSGNHLELLHIPISYILS